MKFLIALLALGVPATTLAVDCSKISVSVKKEGIYYYATAKDQNDKVCGRGESANKDQAKKLAKNACGCDV